MGKGGRRLLSRISGRKETLSKNDKREQKKRKVLRTELRREESEKPFGTWRPWRKKVSDL